MSAHVWPPHTPGSLVWDCPGCEDVAAEEAAWSAHGNGAAMNVDWDDPE
ncbi:hypothetical protein [Streptomyces sp. NPDC048211]